MSNRAHRRGLERARQRRDADRASRRRRRWVTGVVVVMILALVATFVLALIQPRGDTPVIEGPTPGPTSPAEAAAAVACGATRPAAADETKPTFSEPPTADIDPGTTRYRATMTTSCGDIVIDLFADRSPTTVDNFVALARSDYYAGVTFHRVVQGFVIQAGDPTGTGGGDPGYTIEGELEAAEEEGYGRGIVAMANRGGDPSTASTQFFIVQGQDAGLPPQYAVFGQVVEGMGVVDRIAAIPTTTVGGQQDVPAQTVYIESVTIEEIPAEDPSPPATEETTP